MSSGGVTWQSGENAGSPPYFDTSFRPHYLAGPCTFTYSVSNRSPAYSSVFNYEVVPANGIQMVIGSNAVIHVPGGQRLRLMDGSYPIIATVTLTNGASSTFYLSPVWPLTKPTQVGYCSPEGLELTGPLTVAVGGTGLGYYAVTSSCFLTYFFASDLTQVVGEAIQSPVGSIITVEKSTDLQKWHPAYVATENNSPTAFYRLSVVK
jgi:hypothetical protein